MLARFLFLLKNFSCNCLTIHTATEVHKSKLHIIKSCIKILNDLRESNSGKIYQNNHWS